MTANFKWSVFAGLAVSIVLALAPVHATTLLKDNFDGTTYATNSTVGGVGTGWTDNLTTNPSGAGGTAVESGGLVTLSRNGGFPTALVSKDALNPTGTTMTWVVNSRSGTGNPGIHDKVDMGWIIAGGQPERAGGSEDPQVLFQMRTDRAQLVFGGVGGIGTAWTFNRPSAVLNQVYNWDGTTPVTVTLFLDATTYHLTATGTNVAIDQTGSSGFATLLTNAGGTMRAFAAAGADSATNSGVFDSVLVTSADPVPEPCTIALAGLGLFGLGWFAWRRPARR